ncbi:MAG: GAF domain-containing sensor histidine kinase [Candidatus Dormibacteraeota bacterium]|nr:GAF domain-containing sensor histidine kinase [Candidatus Dormibacteraeota bacterium]
MVETEPGGRSLGASAPRPLQATGDGAETARALRGLLNAAARLSWPLPVADLARLAIEEAAVALPRMRSFVALVEPGSPGFIRLVAASATWDSEPPAEEPIEGSWTGLALHQGRPVNLYRDRDEARSVRPWFRDGAGAVRLVPLLPAHWAEDHRPGLGVMGFTRPQTALFTEMETMTCDELGRQLAQAVLAAETRDELERRARRLEASVDVAMDLATRDPDGAAQQLLRRAVDAAKADRGILLSASGRRLVVSHLHGARGLGVPRGTPASFVDGLVGSAVDRRVSVLGTADDLSLMSTPYQRLLKGMRHFAIVPLVLGGQAEAVLVVARRRDTALDADDVSLLQQIGNVAGLALRSNRLLREALEAREEATETARRLGIGVNVAADLASSLDPGEVGSRLLSQAAGAVRADRGVLCHMEGSELVVESGFALDDVSATASGTRFEVPASGFVREALEHRKPVTASAPGTNLSLSALNVEAMRRQRHALSVPLVLSGTTTGIFVLWRSADEPFEDSDIAVVQTIANVAVLALQNAHAFTGVEGASAAKTMFLNMAAHELRTPLTVISGYLAMLAEGSIPPEAAQQRVYPMMRQKTDELARLVDGLLVAARLERDAAAPNDDRPIDIVVAAQEAVARVKPRADLVDATVELEVPAGSVLAHADRESLGRILDNLLNNALTYAREAPWVRVSVGGDRRFVVVTVEDHGLGVPEDKRDAIFERLVRVDRPEIGYPSGTGLGLYISRELARNQGGTLVLADSQPGEGSTFVLSLRRPVPNE